MAARFAAVCVSKRAVNLIPVRSFVTFRASHGFSTDQRDISHDLRALNSEVENLFGPLGDPDYEEEKSPNRPGFPQTSDVHQNAKHFTNGDNITDMGSLKRPMRNLATHKTRPGRDPIEAIIELHEQALTGQIAELLADHRVRLAAAIRTEIELQASKRSK